MDEFRPRSGQRQVLAYDGGKMAIAAVPGSGKTHTLAALAANLVCTAIEEDQEVLIVTLVNSAVDNFRQRINRLIEHHGLLVNFGYRVRTLHGLAHDIVRERPGLVGLSEDFKIIDEREADSIREQAVEAWLRAHPHTLELFLRRDLEEYEISRARQRDWPALVREIASAFIKTAKDENITPEMLHARTNDMIPASLEPLVDMGTQIYADYQRSLTYRGAVDFDDLIRLALEALRRDKEFLDRLRKRWPYVLEDEAQDSSNTQEQILALLAGDHGNWVRVGDPNQAIYHTFTNADPKYLRSFLVRPGVSAVDLAQSGRSQQTIMDFANFLVKWTLYEHPVVDVRDAFAEQYILPTDPGDPQPNPPCNPSTVQILDGEYSPKQELNTVIDLIAEWLPQNPDRTVAILVPRNQRGFEVTDQLQKRGIPCIELLRSTSMTRATAGSIGNLLRCLADPLSGRRLATAFSVWHRDKRNDPEANPSIEITAVHLRRCTAVEDYLWPRMERDWLASIALTLSAEQLVLLSDFRSIARRWHRAALLPVDQLVVTLANDLFHEAAELALAHKLARLLRDVADAHPTYRLGELVEELAVIARNERRFLGFTKEDSGFSPPSGKVTVVTMHKAKGLEWDRVYLLAVNNYGFPSGLQHDQYISEKWFVRDELNLQAEVLACLESISASARSVIEGSATQLARQEYIEERLRLLYVGITRAKRDLIITWNTGRRRSERLQPAIPLLALEQHQKESLKDIC